MRANRRNGAPQEASDITDRELHPVHHFRISVKSQFESVVSRILALANLPVGTRNPTMQWLFDPARMQFCEKTLDGWIAHPADTWKRSASDTSPATE